MRAVRARGILSRSVVAPLAIGSAVLALVLLIVRTRVHAPRPPEKDPDDRAPNSLDAFSAGLLATVGVFFLVASLLTIILYYSEVNVIKLGPWSDLGPAKDPSQALWLAFIVGALAWLVCGIWYGRFTFPASVNPLTFAEVNGRYHAYKALIEDATDRFPDPVPGDTETPAHATNALAKEYLGMLGRRLRGGGRLTWVIGTGYIDLWGLVHRLEEALLATASRREAISEGLHDLMRVRNSNIEDRDDLLGKLERVLEDLGAPDYLYTPPAAPRQPPSGIRAAGSDPTAPAVSDSRTVANGPVPAPVAAAVATATTDLVGSAPPRASTPEAVERIANAKIVLQQVRLTVNTYRDARREGMVQARISLIRTLIATCGTTYALLVLAAVFGNARDHLASATAIFMVGAMIGLLNRLSNESQMQSGVEDFGLTDARLITTPVLSGLAALGGVLLAALLPGLLDQSTTVAGGATDAIAGHVATLSGVFAVESHPLQLVIGAIFGLTPSLLLNRLQKEAEKCKADLRSSQTGQVSRPPS